MSQLHLFDSPYPTQGAASIVGSAILSPCGTYRYRLERRWGPGPFVLWVMCNPSKATADEGDATVSKIMAYTRRWGFGRLVGGNLFALRSTDPGALELHSDPIGPDNDQHLLEAAQGAARVICAWGTWGAHRGRGAVVEGLLRAAGVELWALKITKGGQPGHPLYLPGNLEPMRWEGVTP